VEVYIHSFFNLGTRWRWVVSFTPRPLYPQRVKLWTRFTWLRLGSSGGLLWTRQWMFGFERRARYFLINWGNIRLSGRTLLRRVGYSMNRIILNWRQLFPNRCRPVAEYFLTAALFPGYQLSVFVRICSIWRINWYESIDTHDSNKEELMFMFRCPNPVLNKTSNSRLKRWMISTMPLHSHGIKPIRDRLKLDLD
jgi:hypothetical protein